MQNVEKIKVISTFFTDLTVGKVYDVIAIKDGYLYVNNDWESPMRIFIDPDLVKYEVVK